MDIVKKKSEWFFNGLAMFSMFFGAGNIIFPLIVGLNSGPSVFWSLAGLFFTAVMIPFSGLIAMALFNGDYCAFFSKIGKIPGKVLVWSILALIGPFGGIPRCIGLTFSTLKVNFESLGLFEFGLVFSMFLFLSTLRKRKVIDLLGYVLTPVLLFFLLMIVLKGVFFSGKSLEGLKMPAISAFSYGLQEGYNTMDLLAAFFFSSALFGSLKKNALEKDEAILLNFLKSVFLGALLLGFVYLGFALIAAIFHSNLKNVQPDELLGVIGKVTLGQAGGFVVSVSVLLSCFTTAIALTTISADFLKKELFREKINHANSILVVLGTSLVVSTLRFSKIVYILAPILQVFYPSLLALCVAAVANKLYGFKYIKSTVYFILMCVILNQVASFFK
jgi:LIVCS family branched-chain amino acid:cation transporter